MVVSNDVGEYLCTYVHIEHHYIHCVYVQNLEIPFILIRLRYIDTSMVKPIYKTP